MDCEHKASRRDLIKLIHAQSKLINTMQQKIEVLEQLLENYEEYRALKKTFTLPTDLSFVDRKDDFSAQS